MKKIFILMLLLIFISSCTSDPSVIKVDYSKTNSEQASQFAEGAVRVLFSYDFNNVKPNLAYESLVWESDEIYLRDSDKAQEIYEMFAGYNSKYRTHEEFVENKLIKVVATNNVVNSGVFEDLRADTQEEFEEGTIEWFGPNAVNKVFKNGNYFVYIVDQTTGKVSDPFIILTKEADVWKILSYPIR